MRLSFSGIDGTKVRSWGKRVLGLLGGALQTYVLVGGLIGITFGVTVADLLGIVDVLPWGRNVTKIVPSDDNTWRIDLLDVTRFNFLSYENSTDTSTADRKGPELFRTASRPDGVVLEVSRNTTLEVSESIDFPRDHLGEIVLAVELEGAAEKETAVGSLYLMRRAADPVVLDRFAIAKPIARRYKVTAFAGHSGTLLLKLVASRDEDLDVVLRKLSIASAPPRGAIVVHSLRSWDHKNLDGFYDDFWFRIEKVDADNLIYLRQTKFGKDGYTILSDLRPERYRITAALNSLVLEEIGRFDMSDVAGWFARFYLAQATPVRVHVIDAESTTGIAGCDIVVETLQHQGGPVRGGEHSERRLLTNDDGLSPEVWLYPAANPKKNYYIIRALYNGREIGRVNYHLGQGASYKKVVTIVAHMSES